MPAAAVATRAIDRVLPLGDIAGALVGFSWGNGGPRRDGVMQESALTNAAARAAPGSAGGRHARATRSAGLPVARPSRACSDKPFRQTLFVQMPQQVQGGDDTDEHAVPVDHEQPVNVKLHQLRGHLFGRGLRYHREDRRGHEVVRPYRGAPRGSRSRRTLRGGRGSRVLAGVDN